MSQVTQKEAVHSAVLSVLSENNVTVNEGEDFSAHITRELRAQITNILVEGFNSGNISLDKPRASDSDLRTYCSGLISNWLRKDGRLNGGTKYIAKNPGSRAGSGDTALKAMRLLLQAKSDPADRQEIQTFIDARIAEVKTARKPAKVLDVNALPPELRHLVTT
jgi:hypothetical protein